MLCSAVCACIGQLLWKVSADVGVWMAFEDLFFMEWAHYLCLLHINLEKCQSAANVKR